MTLLENTENLGFVATVNRGMALNDDNDVLLLNSDAEVANDWLDRIQRAAYSQPHVASVTPFSNNATICSYPRFCEPNPLPTDCTTGSLDRLFAQHLAGQTIAIPTGVGFCMYVRRKCLQEVGLFDVARFGKGYGEENDFCVRAQKAGWINLHALDTFVRHSGGISFGASKSERELQAYEILKVLHPSYEPDVQNFVKLDPARSARMRIDMARITGSHKPVVLSVTHNREGGTMRHIQEVAQQLGKLGTFLRLTPAPKGVVLRLEGVSEGFELHFALPQELDHLEQTLRLLQVAHVHYHHVLGHDASIFELSTLLGVSHDFTAHDYYSYCPQISLTDHTDRYCGEQGLAQCHQCLQRNPAPENMSIEAWRERYTTLLNHARYVMAPSEDTAQRMQRFVPAARVQVVPHAQLFPDAPEPSSPQARTVAGDQPLKVVVLGALSKIKGADVLEAVATLAANEKSPIDFHLIGYAYRSLRTQPKARLTVHGAYEEQELPILLAWLKPDVVWFPALWPETYSYTLSASLEARLPIIAPTIGAFAERLQNRDWTWLCDWQNSPKVWLAFFEHIRAHHFCTGTSPAPIEMPEQSTTQIERNVAYFDNYLGQLPTPVASDSAELALQQRQIDFLQHRTDPPATPIKSSALRAIIYLRAMSALSPVAKLVPTHVQRRVKSWLRN